MEFDDRPEPARRLEEARVARGFKTPKAAAEFFGWVYETYIQHEQGTRGISRQIDKYARAFKVSEGWLLSGEGRGPEGESRPAGAAVPLMGFIGAGAEIEPEFEQVPPDGLDQIHIPFAVPDDMIAFGVRGDSMLPVYKDGSIVVVHREQKRPLASFFGEDAAVRTSDGRRFIKTVMRGSDGTVSLFSWNAAPIENVSLEWIGEIFAVLPPSGMRKMAKQGGIQGNLKL